LNIKLNVCVIWQVLVFDVAMEILWGGGVWLSTPCGVVVGYQRLRVLCCLHLQGELCHNPEDLDVRFFGIIPVEDRISPLQPYLVISSMQL
jgi:hypothetical protein